MNNYFRLCRTQSPFLTLATILCLTFGSGLNVSLAMIDYSVTLTRAVYDSYGRLDLAWTGPTGYIYNFVYVAPGAKLPGANVPVNFLLGAHSFIYRPVSAGLYTLVVKTCLTQDPTQVFPSCIVSPPVTLNATTLPPSKETTLSFPHTSSGDCELDGATVTFFSNGSGVFKGRVKTNHTHSGDVWHATIAAANAANQDIIRLSTFDSIRMSDDHGYYPWVQSFEYDPLKFGGIVSVSMLARC